MKKENRNEELQSRREFFKKAAKGALPIVAALALAGTPNLLKAAEKTPYGCGEYTCSYGCKNGCKGCEYTCKGACKNSCRTGCYASSR